MQKLNVNDETMTEYKMFVIGKHGKLREAIQIETETAIRNHMRAAQPQK